MQCCHTVAILPPMKPKSDSVRFRIAPCDRRLAIRLAANERRTLSSFLINLIHERAERNRSQPGYPMVTVEPVDVNAQKQRRTA